MSAFADRRPQIKGVFLQWVLDPENVDVPEAAEDITDVLYQGVRRDD